MANQRRRSCPYCHKAPPIRYYEDHLRGCLRGLVRLQQRMGLIEPAEARAALERGSLIA